MENYSLFFSNPFYLRILLFSVLLANLIVISCIVIAFPVALFLARTPHNGLKTLVLAILIMPFFISAIVRVYGWTAILGYNGVVNNTLLALRLTSAPLPLLFNLNGVVIGLIDATLSFMVFSIYSSLANADQSLEEAALVLGASRLRVFWKITLPISLPGIMSGSILVFAIALSAFVQPSLLGGGRVQTLSTILITKFLGVINWPFGTAVGFIMLGIALIVIFVALRLFKIPQLVGSV